MIAPPFPHDETSRLRALFDYHVLDTDPEKDFDELTELVARILDVPIALVSLIDANRQWFKSHHGLDATETPRELAFCAHAILHDEVFVVEDSHKDVRFADNPLVTGDPNVRYYAGAPLITPEGHKIGTICGIDDKPHQITPDQQRFLQIIAKQVISQLELRKNISIKDALFLEQNKVLEQLESANQQIQDLVSVVAHDLRAPILNFVGFSEELEASTTELNDLIEQFRDQIPSDLRTRSTCIIDDDIRDFIVHMKRSADQMRERIDAITTLSRHGRCQLTTEEINLRELVDGALDSHALELKKLNAEVEISELPLVTTSNLALQIVIENLVANAIKYRSIDRTFRMQISASGGSDGTEIQVRDNGRGIREEDLEKVFVLFRRVGEQNTSGDGTGLAFCRVMVSRQGGKIWCESEFGVGTNFHVFLPHSREQVAA